MMSFPFESMTVVDGRSILVADRSLIVRDGRIFVAGRPASFTRNIVFVTGEHLRDSTCYAHPEDSSRDDSICYAHREDSRRDDSTCYVHQEDSRRDGSTCYVHQEELLCHRSRCYRHEEDLHGRGQHSARECSRCFRQCSTCYTCTLNLFRQCSTCYARKEHQGNRVSLQSADTTRVNVLL